MVDFVIDASIALTWCFSDEATKATEALLERLDAESAVVPQIWSLEVGNTLIMAERRKRITYAEITQFLELLKFLNIDVDHETSNKGLCEVLALAHSEGLTTYDAAYLELAMRKGIPLATKDKLLLKVAKKIGVKALAV